MFQQRISFFCCQRISRRTRIFLCVLLRLLLFFLNRRPRRKTQKLFSCPSLELLYISAHFCVFCGFFIINGFHGFHGFNYLCNLCNLLTFIIQFHGYSYLRVLRVLRWQPHHVRCFTHLFCTFIGGKFEVFFRDLNHKTTVRPP